MTSDRDEDDSTDGIRVDLPFGSFRVGRGAKGWHLGVNESDAYAGGGCEQGSVSFVTSPPTRL